jgi:diguanylate cyclase (GGDEF)-like protein/PAS domain S-box-containing protein
MSILGAFTACVFAIAIPSVYYVISINGAQHTLTIEAAFLAKSIEKIIQDRPDLWEYESVRLKELISQLSINGEEDEREIRNAAGKLIAKNDFTKTRPIISVSVTFFDAGRLAGSIVARHSIRTQIITTALTGILSSLLGFLLYFIFRTYPIRKLENTLIDLQRAHDELEQRVADRTEELMRVNEELRIEITERKQAGDDLRKSEERYRTILEDIDEGYYENDLAGNFTFVNDAECRDLGYSREELIGMNYRQYSDEATAKNLYELFYNIYNTGKPVKRFLGQFISKDGTHHFNEVSASLIRDAKGKPIGFRGVSQDITARKRAEEELRLNEERFRRIFDEGPFGMILANPDYTIIAVNKAFCGLLGYSEQELAGQSIADITCEEDREKSREFSGKLFTGSIPVLRLEKRYVRKDGGIMWANITASALHGKEGNVLYGLVIIEDLTDSKKAAEKIHLLHYYDSLTGLPNRTFHKELIKRSIEHAQRHKEIFALIYIGLDNFQRINDTLGHSIGDLLLKAVADRLTNSLRKSDYVARSDEGETVNVVSRVGGDEFIAVAHDLNQAQDAAIASRRLLREISAPYDLSGREVFMTASIGIALYPDDGTDVDDLLKNAEKAMRHTKNEGKNNYQFYSGSMNSFVLELLTLESDLHKALERNELMLYYQPKVDAATRMVKGMEALIRWKHSDKGLIPPIQFIPLAETSGLIIPIGEFVIRTVCGQIKTWQEAGYKQMNIALNVSSRQFDQQSLIEIVKEALQDAMIPPQCLELEITESIIMRNPEKAIRTLTELKAMGIQIAIDDFGTGYSSLSYLKRLPLDFLKIDQSFVKGLASDPSDQAIVRATIAMARSLNLKTIAEGVETEEQLSFLQKHGCDEIQGYLFSRPLPAEEIPGILAKGYL